MNRLLYVVPLLLFLCLFHLATPNGVFSGDFDSNEFKHAANTWSEKGILEETNSDEFVHWPPLYPIILSLFSFNVEIGAKWFHAACLSLTILLWINIFQALIKDKIVLLGLALINACSLHSVYLGRFLWVESLFVLLVSLMIWNLLHWSGWKSVVTVLLVGLAMAFLRTASILFWINIVLATLILRKAPFRWQKILSFFPLLIVWLSYRLLVSHRGTVGKISTLNLESYFEQFSNNISWYYGFVRECFVPFIPYHIVFELGFVTLILYLFLKKQIRENLPKEIIFIWILVTLYINEVLCVTIIKGFGDYSEIFRYLAVVSPGIYLLGYYLLDQIINNNLINRKWVYLTIILLLGVNIVRTLYQIANWNTWI